MTNLQQYQLVELIQDRMEFLSEVKGYSTTSITKLTGFSDETRTYEIIYTALKLTSEKSLNKYSNEQYALTYEQLGDVIAELEEAGY